MKSERVIEERNLE